MRIRWVKRLSETGSLSTCGRTLLLGIQGALEPPAPKAPGAPGSHVVTLLFYKAITAGNKGWIGPAKLNSPVDGRQGLRSEMDQIIDVDLNTLARDFTAVTDVVVGDHGGEIDQRTDIERCRQRHEVDANQPFVGAVQHDASDDQQQPECDQQHPDKGRDAPPGEQVDLNIEIES